LLVLAAHYPRPVDARILAHVANDSGDQTQGNRVLASLESRKYIARDHIGRSVDRRTVLKWRMTHEGWVALCGALPQWVDATNARMVG
jgi:hypothetical protein